LFLRASLSSRPRNAGDSPGYPCAVPTDSLRPVRALNIHAGYECRHSGFCCTAGWDIGAERRIVHHIATQVEAARIPVPGCAAVARPTRHDAFVWEHTVSAGLQAHVSSLDAEAVLRQDPSGACVFFDRPAGNLCAVQRQCGHRWLPAACRHFPRVTLIDAQGAFVTLSHFCPTAAHMLFRTDVTRTVIASEVPGLSDRGEHEGYDATATVPPFVRPGVMFDADSRCLWDDFVVDVCGVEGAAPEDVLAGMARGADRLRSWTPARGALHAFAHEELDGQVHEMTARVGFKRQSVHLDRVARLFAIVAATVPSGISLPVLPDDMCGHDARLMAPQWAGLSRPVCRYLAARAFGAWSAYQGEGVRTQVAVVAAALAVLRVEAVRQAATAGRPLDAGLLAEAFRAADLLTVHQSSSDDVVRALGDVEHGTSGEFLDALGLDDHSGHL
jgi:hypothetical protein